MDSEKRHNRRIFNRTLVRASAFLIVILGAILFYFLMLNYGAWSREFAYIISGMKSIIIGVAIAYLLNPLANKMEGGLHKLFKKEPKDQKAGLRRDVIIRTVCAFTVVFGMVGIVLVLLGLLLPQVVISVSGLIRNFPHYIDEITDLIQSNVRLREFLNDILTNASQFISDWLDKNVLQNIQSYITSAASGVVNVVTLIGDIGVGLIVAVYVLCSARTFKAQAKKIVYALFNKRQAKVILDTTRKSNEIFGGFISGKLVDSLIVGLLCFAGMTLLRMPYVALVSVIVGVTNVIPFFGPWIGMVPSTIIVMLADFRKGIIVLIFIILLQQLDGNVIGPKILGKSTGLSAFWVVFSVMLFGKMWGILGMLVGVPVFGVIYYIVETFINYRLKLRGMPTETEGYKDLDYFAEDGTFVTLDGKKMQRELRREERREQRLARKRDDDADGGQNGRDGHA